VAGVVDTSVVVSAVVETDEVDTVCRIDVVGGCAALD